VKLVKSVSVPREAGNFLTVWLLASQRLNLVQSVVFCDLLIKFLQNEGNYLNRLHSAITR